MMPETKGKVLFVPKLKAAEGTSERSPMMLKLLRERFRVEEVPAGRVCEFACDPRGHRFARYLMFPLGELHLFLRTLSRLRKEQAVVFAEGSYFALPAALACKLRSAPAIWDNHGNVRTYGKSVGKSLYFIASNEMLEGVLERLSAKVLVVSERDRQSYVEAGFPHPKLEVVPTCVELAVVDRTPAKDEARKKLGLPGDVPLVLFFGTLSYGPNLEAASCIAQNIAPRVRGRIPGARFAIAGGGCPPGGLGDGVDLLGFVPDIHLWISASDVCIAPIWSGVGILTKVIDMLSHSRPTVVSPLALDGMPELHHGTNCLVGQNAQGFADNIVAVLRDKEMGWLLGRSGRELVEAKYSCDRIGAQVKDLVRGLMEEYSLGAEDG
ncbi:MAG: glycosyltransferase family 4 protein [Methanomassiliicoccales archaeon]|nr:glycosyltransferase family 4 protein [Methanomassiliicoccales archaeon]